jgi:AcrR family transcriptional regulator
LRTVKDPVVRKNEIVAASIELFQNNGYEKTTIESIITYLGVAKGCFYHHFRSKEEVFEACIARLTRSTMEAYQRILTDQNKTARQKLLDYVSFNFQLARQNPPLAETIHSETFEAIHARVIRESVRQITPVFIRLIEQGQADGDFKTANAEFSAVALLGAFHEIHIAYSHRLELEMTRLEEWIIDLMGRILQTEFQE